VGLICTTVCRDYKDDLGETRYISGKTFFGGRSNITEPGPRFGKIRAFKKNNRLWLANLPTHRLSVTHESGGEWFVKSGESVSLTRRVYHGATSARGIATLKI